MDMSKYTEIFIEEAKEHLQSLNQNLLEMEKNPKETSMVNEIFRIAHTLKGMAGTMGYSKMTRLTHVMEDALHLIRTGERKINTGMVDTLFECLDALEGYVSSIANGGSEGDGEHSNLVSRLSAIVKGEEPEASGKGSGHGSFEPSPIASVSSASTGNNSYGAMALNQYEKELIEKAKALENNIFRVDMTLENNCLLKSARAFLFFQTLERHGEIIKSNPIVQDIEDEKFEHDISVLIISKSSLSEIKNEMDHLSEVEKCLVAEFGEELPVNSEIVQTVKLEEDAPRESDEASTGAANAASKAAKHGKTVRVDIGRLDVLMNLVSELIIIKTSLEGIRVDNKNENYGAAIEYLERITTNLHDAVMKVRMVPVETVFNRFPRMIRDIAKDLKKDIQLELSGEETELDRTVIDEIGDPLIHLLRNSVDHGIESVEDRIKNGKAEKGHIFLRAYPDGNNVVIEVEDDGAGINIDRIKKKAIQKGMVGKDVANTLTHEDVINFLFQPGFSTQDTVTDLSGRGVGLDVVRTKIESLGGVVEVATELGQGTKFTIRLPLTLAIIQALLVLVGDEKYAIPLSSIKEIIKVSPEDIKFVQKREVMILRDTILPILWLEKFFDVKVAPEQQKKNYTVVVVKKGDKQIGLVVDSLIGQQEIVIKSLGKILQKLRIIAGATILGDGNVALIIDINSLS